MKFLCQVGTGVTRTHWTSWTRRCPSTSCTSLTTRPLTRDGGGPQRLRLNTEFYSLWMKHRHKVFSQSRVLKEPGKTRKETALSTKKKKKKA